MSYWANPFDSRAGVDVMMDLFDGLFMDNGRTGFRSRDHARHFTESFFAGRGDMKGVTALRCLTLLYDDVPAGMSRDVGIYHCPTCGRFDHLWNWQFIDMGFYSSFSDSDTAWISGDYRLRKVAGGLYKGNGYGVIAQVRCNEVSHCTHCGISHQAPDSDIENCSICGRGPAKDQDDGLGMVQAGCGAMSTAFHEIPPITEAMSYTVNATARSQKLNLVTLVASKSLTIKVPRAVRPESLRLEWAGDSGTNRQGQVYRTLRDAMVWVPEMVMTLERVGEGRGSPNDPLRFPFSMFGGYSDNDSPLYPGMTAFGGSHVIRYSNRSGAPDFNLSGYRTSNSGSGMVRSWRASSTRLPGYTNTAKSPGRVPIGASNGDASRQNRAYHLEIPSVSSGVIWDDMEASRSVHRYGYVGINSSAVNISSYGGSRINSESDMIDALPVMRFRTECPNYLGQLVDGRCGKCGGTGHSGLSCRGPAVTRVNLLNPSIRDIDDWGMIRAVIANRGLDDVGERVKWPGTLWPIPTIPSILNSTDPPLVGIGKACPNDVVAGYMSQCYMIDSQERVLSEIRRFLDSSNLSATTGVRPDYPWGISKIGDITDPNVKDVADSFGLTTPADPPGSFFSYLIAVSKARAISRNRPCFSMSRRVPQAYNGNPGDPDLDPADIRNLREEWFYVYHGGSGSRRTGDLVPPIRYRRFGTVELGREMVEDFLHPSGITPLPPNVIKTHDLKLLPRGMVLDPDELKAYNTDYCITCRQTHFIGDRSTLDSRGSILKQFQDSGVITDLVLDPNNGAPASWTFNPRNSKGMAEWMVAAHVAWEDNRKFVICGDPSVEPTGPAGVMESKPYYLAPMDEADGGIKDSRFPVPMGFVPEDDLESIPGLVDIDPSYKVGGVRVRAPTYVIWDLGGINLRFEAGEARSDYLLSEPGDHSDYSPLLLSNVAGLRAIGLNNGPFYRREIIDGETYYLPVMWGVLRDGHTYTAGISSLAAGGVP